MVEGSTSTSTQTISFDAYNAKLQSVALAATRKSAAIPADVAFHRSMDQELARDLDAFSERVLSMTNRLLNLVSTVDQAQAGKGKGKLESQDDLVDNFHALVVDSMDQLLEKTDICLDEFLGKNKAPSVAINPPILSNNRKDKVNIDRGRVPEPVIQHAAHLPKPQAHFPRKVDNSDAVWYSTLSHKFNAKVPLGYVYSDSDEASANGIVANHPYRYEITHLSYPPYIFEPCVPLPPLSFEDTQATWISTSREFQDMLAQLKKAAEIAVDLEHHSYRSYSGFLCLMQISTREGDWVIDLLAPEVRSEVEGLNEVFTDPGVVKVFHGAESDIVWLQQDFNIYIVNLFDTFHASKLLDFPRHGLANLLEMYCDFIPDKRYQLADWRIRPLPQDMLKYARSDTHFLLYIYDNLRNALLDRSQSRSQSRAQSPTSSSNPPFSAPPSSRELLTEALSRSAETSLRVYSKEPYDAIEGSGSGGWDTLAKKWNKGALMADGPNIGIGALQREVYRSVHHWREKVAREEDESTRYVLANHTMFFLAEQPPADMAALLAAFKSSLPPMVKKRAKDLLTTIRDAVKRVKGFSRIGVEDRHGSTEKESLVESSTKRNAIMLEAEMKNLESPENVESKETATGIWGRGVNVAASSASTSQSALFGLTFKSTTKAPNTVSGFATSVSTLLGASKGNHIQASSSSPKIASVPSAHANRPHLQDLVAKIKRSFALASSIPQFITATHQTPVDKHTELHHTDESTSMQVEIPFVPASQRPNRNVEAEKDTIVVVGQARQKRKRKEPKNSHDSPSGSEAMAKAEESTTSTSGDIEPFDFAIVSNILDENPDTEDRKKKRQKKQNKGGVFFGDFPAPPKAYSELKSGNQSHTFK